METSAKIDGLVSGKFAPFLKAHEMHIREALNQCDGDVYVLVYDYPDISDIPTKEMMEMMKVIINNDRCKLIHCTDFPPSGTSQEIIDQHNEYIRAKLPEGTRIGKFFHNDEWARDVADYLGAELIRVDKERVQFPVSAKLIRQDPKRYLSYLHPMVAQRLDQLLSLKSKDAKPLFSEAADSSFLEKPLDQEDKERIKAKALEANPGYDADKLNNVMSWDVRNFGRKNLPAILGELERKQEYSAQKGLRCLDMLIRDPKQGWVLPKEFEQFSEALQMAVEHERSINPKFDEYYIYITIDQKLVLPGKSQRRAGYHSDAYVTAETNVQHNPDDILPADNTYVVADKLPTLYQEGPFPLDGLDPEDCKSVLEYFDEESAKHKPITFKPYQLLKMTPYDIHTPAVNTSGETIERTFIKIQFSRERYNLIGNTVNPLANYADWTWVPRDPNVRNHRNSIIGWNRDDKHLFTHIYPYSVDFSQQKPDVPWANENFIWARKVDPVKVEPAFEGEMISTRHGEEVMTINIAQKGDLKITTSRGDQYFLSQEKFKSRYKAEPDEKGLYHPNGKAQKMLITKQPVMLRAPWGAMQYAPAGSALTTLGLTDTYVVHKNNFEASFEVIDVSQEKPQSLVNGIGQVSVCSVCGKCTTASASKGC